MCPGKELETLKEKEIQRQTELLFYGKYSFKIALMMHLCSNNLEDSLWDLFVRTHVCPVLRFALIDSCHVTETSVS